MKKNTSWISLLLLLFVLVFVQAMTLVYVDGDDATSIAYHIAGRNPELQLPYSPYQGMADLILCVLSPNEMLLRHSALIATNVALIVFVLLLLSLVFSWVQLPARLPKWLITLAFFLAVPELSYIGLVYSPTLVAMSFILGAHLVARKSYRERWLFGRWGISAIGFYLLSILFFGIGVSFRWNTLLYGGVIFVDLVLLAKKYRDISLRDFLPNTVWLWGMLAVLAAFLMLAISGYGIGHFVDQFSTVRYVFNQAGTLTPNAASSPSERALRTILTLTPEFTPAFILFVAVGMLIVSKQKNPLWLVVAFGVLSVLPWMRSGNPKFIITSLPVLALLFVIGFRETWQWFYKQKWQRIKMLPVFALLLLPWLVGVQISRPNTSWGPDFSLKKYAYEDVESSAVDLVFDTGMAFPSPEGPRSLWGHAYVLFAGGWRDMVEQSAFEREAAIEIVVSEQIPMVVTSWSPDFYLNLLYANGYQTNVPYWSADDGDLFALRHFYHRNDSQVDIFFAEFEADALDTLMSGLEKLATQTDSVVLVGYPSTMRAFYLEAPDVMRPIGAEIAQIDLATLFPDADAASLAAETVLDDLEADVEIMEPDSTAGAFATISPAPVDTYLANPGIGWQYDVNPESAVLPETVVYGERLQIGWSVLNPAEGVYDWVILDNMLDTAVAAGKQFSFRVFTMRGERYGDHMLPEWVVEKGARILANGSPDYSNCVYQENWGTFVVALAERYDDRPEIAFVDISGYGNFNEWSWQNQTSWDPVWYDDYSQGTATAASLSTFDSQARRRLADMFIGGSFAEHECRNAQGGAEIVSYEYDGFQNTQLVMPFAGIDQSTQYVFVRDPSVGFRHDCLGSPNTASIPNTFESELAQIWRQAPVVYELCAPEQVSLESAQSLLAQTHGSIVHNNGTFFSASELEALLLSVGYRYALDEARIQSTALAGENLQVEMDWQNIGFAPNYPAMGQDFELVLYVEDENGRAIKFFPVDVNIAEWMPAASPNELTPVYSFSVALPLPASLNAGLYYLKAGIVEQRTGNHIQLAFEGDDGTGKYLLTSFEIVD